MQFNLVNSCVKFCRVDYDGLFGWKTVSNNKEVVITANEFDAMAVHQETGLPALALPKGDSILPQKVCIMNQSAF
jgi:hypothetical protein